MQWHNTSPTNKRLYAAIDYFVSVSICSAWYHLCHTCFLKSIDRKYQTVNYVNAKTIHTLWPVNIDAITFVIIITQPIICYPPTTMLAEWVFCRNRGEYFISWMVFHIIINWFLSILIHSNRAEFAGHRKLCVQICQMAHVLHSTDIQQMIKIRNNCSPANIDAYINSQTTNSCTHSNVCSGMAL